MTTQEHCEAIIRKVVELANKGKHIAFKEDWGGNSLTIFINGAHTHVGGIDTEEHEASFGQLAEELYNSLHGGPGLSWYDPNTTAAASETEGE